MTIQPNTPEERAKLRELLAKATPGEWRTGGQRKITRELDAGSGGDAWSCFAKFYNVVDGEPDAAGQANAELTVALHNAAPFLLAAADENVRLREALEKVSNYSTNKASEFEADFAKQYAEHDACPSCQEAKKRSWPPSGLCNEHYGPFHKLIDRRNDAVESDDKWGRVDIARAALAALNQEQGK